MIVEDQSEVIAFLSRPEAFGRTEGQVDRIETHASAIFLYGNRAYKLKKSVKFPYLDSSTKELRRRYCHAEVCFNQRAAPQIYHGALPICRDERGKLRLGGPGETVDWVVEMTRLPEDTLFDRLAQQGVLDRYAMEDLADTIARFHAEAARRPDAGGAAAIARLIESNAKSFAECASMVVARTKVEELTEASRRGLAKIGPLLDERRSTGYVRHCHSDLHLRNIFLYQGHPTVFDAIEFSSALADIDVLYDLAFLVMDLDHRGLGGLASILLNRYLDNTGDVGGLAAFPLFLSLRAAIRSHVTAASAASHSDPKAAETLHAEARDYLDRAIAYLSPPAPRLIAIGGLSGSGKSRMARDIAPYVGGAPGARIVRTDSMRKRLARVSLETRLGPRNYSREMNARTYQAVLDECRHVLSAGQSVIADAVFAEPGEREAIERVAAEAGVPFDGLWLEAPPEVMEERVTRRRRNVSDATAWVVRLQLQYDLGDIGWQRLNTAGSREETLIQALSLLRLK